MACCRNKLNFISLLLCLKILLSLSYNNIEEVKGKAVIVTGGAQGIGYATAESFLKYSAKVVIIIDINKEKGIKAYITLSSKYGRGRIEFVNCDVTKPCLENTFNSCIKKYKNINLLVNNAGIANEELVKRTIEVNTIAVMKGTLSMLEHMRVDKKGKGGVIINISSIYGFRIDQFVPVYKASKFGVRGFSQSLGHPSNYEKHGVRILTVCPGFTNTTLVKNVIASAASSPEISEFLKTLQEPEVVGEANVEVYKTAESGTAWLIEDKKLSKVD